MKTGLIGAFSIILSTLSASLVYMVFEAYPGWVKLLAIVFCALLIGALQGFFIRPSHHKVVGIASFIGIVILWLPVVLATYGFALLALPLLAAFARLVLAGATLGSKLRANLATPEATPPY